MLSTIKKLKEEELAKIYHAQMKRDFPADELKPLSHILRSMEAGYGFSLGMYEEEELSGYAVFILCEETNCALLDYFAILSDRRGMGMGHRAFSLFEAYFEENLPEVEGLYIESERVSAAENEAQRLVRERRIAFYLSCGCRMTNLRSVLFGVDYSILYKPFRKSGKEKTVRQTGEADVKRAAAMGQTEEADADRVRRFTAEALDALYRKMFKPEHYARCVSLTEE